MEPVGCNHCPGAPHASKPLPWGRDIRKDALPADPMLASAALYHKLGETAHHALCHSHISRVDDTASLPAHSGSSLQHLPCGQMPLCPLSHHERAPGKAAGRNEWGFSGEATYFLVVLVLGQQGSDLCPWEPLWAGIAETLPWETGEKKGFRKLGKNGNLCLGLIFLPGKHPCQEGDYSLGYTGVLPVLQCL